jgi:hypothetical protein
MLMQLLEAADVLINRFHCISLIVLVLRPFLRATLSLILIQSLKNFLSSLFGYAESSQLGWVKLCCKLEL